MSFDKPEMEPSDDGSVELLSQARFHYFQMFYVTQNLKPSLTIPYIDPDETTQTLVLMMILLPIKHYVLCTKNARFDFQPF